MTTISILLASSSSAVFESRNTCNDSLYNAEAVAYPPACHETTTKNLTKESRVHIIYRQWIIILRMVLPSPLPYPVKENQLSEPHYLPPSIFFWGERGGEGGEEGEGEGEGGKGVDVGTSLKIA